MTANVPGIVLVFEFEKQKYHGRFTNAENDCAAKRVQKRIRITERRTTFTDEIYSVAGG